ncbi:MAG: hypothetical protein A2Y33_07975 [Spirochaetes bacterium GWF1_51_8]|nr:MAG: hypothetical protein A2Y33_07975 [Spirochaetes bacterium GWF1_51_8]
MKADSVIRYEGMKVLRENLGLVESEKFINLIKKDNFDYTEWRKDIFKGISAEELFNEAKKYSENIQHSSILKYEIFKNKNNEYQFRLKNSTGDIIYSSESFPTKSQCKKEIEILKNNFLSTEIQITTE